MSDISIPGVSNKYNTQKLIEDLMKLERVPLERAKERISGLEEQKKAWQDLNRRLVSTRESARALFSFQNPFNARTAESSASDVLTATASREAQEESINLTVKQIASADRLMSKRVSDSQEAGAGTYTFTVGDEKLEFNYRGGSLRDFVDNLNRRGGTLVRGQLVPVTPNERILVIEAMKTGSENRLGFDNAAKQLALDLELVKPGNASTVTLAVDQPVALSSALDRSKVVFSEGRLSVGPESEAALKLPEAKEAAGLVLEIRYRFTQQAASEAPPTASGPTIPQNGSVQYEGITIRNAPLETRLPVLPTPPPPVVKENSQILYLLDGSGAAVPLPQSNPGADSQSLALPVAVFAGSISGIAIKNDNTHRTVQIESVRISDPRVQDGLAPANPVSTARDAVLELAGIEITRASNQIEDLIPGVTLNLKKASSQPVQLDIEPDREAVKEAIIGFVGNYNRTMAELNILSRTEDSVLDELGYLTPEEKTAYEKRLGMFQGDSTMGQIRNSMQRIMMDAHATREGAAILGSFGISTNSQAGGGYDATRLRGYLEIDEKRLEQALESDFNLVKDSFGFDTDNDLIVDAGAAVAMDNLVRPYVETGGIVTLKTRTLDGMITREQTTIGSLETQLARKEADLKRKYGMMESALNQMESTSSAWTNFTNQNSGND